MTTKLNLRFTVRTLAPAVVPAIAEGSEEVAAAPEAPDTVDATVADAAVPGLTVTGDPVEDVEVTVDSEEATDDRPESTGLKTSCEDSPPSAAEDGGTVVDVSVKA